MKTPSSSVKIITLSVFTALIVCFICYRVGAFESFSTSQTSAGISTGDLEFMSNPNAIDSPIVANDSVIVQREIMSSSKSMIIHKTSRVDTIKKTNTTKTPSDSSTKKVIKKTIIMSSSKSAIIYQPQPSDTSKKQKK